jgi:ribonuclease Z
VKKAGLLLPLLGLALGCHQLADRLLVVGLEQNMGADLRDELPDGLHVLLCGAGGPLPDPVRSGPCVAIVAGRQVVLVDAGSGAARNLAAMALAPALVEAVFLSHFHSDHIDGLGEVATLGWAGGARQEPLPLYGPPGVSRVAAGFNEAYALDARYRTAHHGEAVVPSGGAGLLARSFELPTAGTGRVVYEHAGLRVRAFSVDHSPVSPAVGYRFDYAGRSVVVSGDTVKSAEVEREATGVDLLVHDALAAQMVARANEAAAKAGLSNLVKITVDIPDYHATPVQVAELAEAAGVRHLLYYHIVPPLPLSLLEGLFLKGVADAYSGPVTLGQDGTLVSLPGNSQEIEVGEL